jgi:hypothetical protein
MAFRQSPTLHEVFVDSNLTTGLAKALNLTTGVNLLLGRANADGLRYGVRLRLDGVSEAPSIDSVSPKGTVDFTDRRNFFGAYAQTRYELAADTSLLAGIRWNSTRETRDEARVNSRGVLTLAAASQDVDRFSGNVDETVDERRVWIHEALLRVV